MKEGGRRAAASSRYILAIQQCSHATSRWTVRQCMLLCDNSLRAHGRSARPLPSEGPPSAPNFLETSMRRPVLTSVAFAVATLAACSEGGSPSSDPQVNFNVATRPASAAAMSSLAMATAGTPETFTDGSNTLIVEQVQMVLREIELKRVETASGCDGSDACEKLEVGPLLLDLPLGTGGAAHSFSVDVSAGSYDEVEFEVHKPSNDDA